MTSHTPDIQLVRTALALRASVSYAAGERVRPRRFAGGYGGELFRGRCFMKTKIKESAELSETVLHSSDKILTDFYVELCEKNLLAAAAFLPLLEDYRRAAQRIQGMFSVITKK